MSGRGLRIFCASITMNVQKQIEALHAEFCVLVPEGRCVLNAYRVREWFDWLKWREPEAFSIADLRSVVAYRRALIAQNRQFPACLKFSYLVGRPDLFEEDLSMARNAPPPRTNREMVLEATGRPGRLGPQKPPRMAAGLVQEALGRLREALR